MEENDSFDEFYAKLKDIANNAFSFGETISEPKVVRKVLRSQPEKFKAKIPMIEDSKDIDKILLTELIGNLQTYKMGLTRMGKSNSINNMALKAKSSDTNEYYDHEDSKMKFYITKQFKKFMKNVNAKGFDKDRKQSGSSQLKSQYKGKKDAKDDSQYIVTSKPKCFKCQGLGHMKQERTKYFELIGKARPLQLP